MLGVIAIVFAVGIAWYTGMFKRLPNQKTVLGRIIRVDAVSGLDVWVKSEFAVIQYEAGDTLLETTTPSSNKSKIGTKRWVSFDSEKPQTAFVRPSLSVYMFVAACLIFGVLSFFA